MYSAWHLSNPKYLNMNRSSTQTIFNLIRTLVVTFFKLMTMSFALLCKVSGMLLLKTGETIEKMITR